MDLTEKERSRTYLFKGKILNLRRDEVELPNGHLATREVVEHPGGVAVVALTDENEVLLVRQYRRPYDTVLLEIPAGKLDAGEDPCACGLRELKEETGYTAKTTRPLGCFYPSPGFADEVIYLYLATGLTPGDMQPDEDEFLAVEKLPLDEIYARVMHGEVRDGKTIIGILKAKNLLQADK